MSTTSTIYPGHARHPDHVPESLIKAFDFDADPGMRSCPFAATAPLHGEGDDIFWNPDVPRFGGAWVLTRATDIRYVLTHTDLFSNKGEAGFSQLLGENWDLIPLELAPPSTPSSDSFSIRC